MRKPRNKAGLVFGLLLAAWMLGSAFAWADNDPPMERISMRRARVIALRKFPGKVRDFEFEIRGKKWVYFFKIAGKDQRFHNIAVDAVTGKVTSKTSEPMPLKAKPLVVPTPAG